MYMRGLLVFTVMYFHQYLNPCQVFPPTTQSYLMPASRAHEVTFGHFYLASMQDDFALDKAKLKEFPSFAAWASWK